MTQARVDGSDGLGPPGFTRQDMQNMVFSDRQYAGELARDDLVKMCRGMPGGLAPTSSGPPVQVGDACDVLVHWDLHENLGSRGAVLFRRFWGHASGAEPSPWAHAFDPSDPVHTPNTLDTTNPMVRLARSSPTRSRPIRARRSTPTRRSCSAASSGYRITSAMRPPPR